MQKLLNEAEARALGSLVEKQVTTPEYYPLTLNALTLACNQKNNRNPVVSFDEEAVAHALESLREKNLVYVFYGSSSRAPKYKQMMTEVFELSPQELALMCVLMLRGSQTVGELRGRTDRLYDFTGLEEVEEALNSLAAKEPQPLVAKLPRQPGQKEARFAHLLSGDIDVEAIAATNAKRADNADPNRISKLESEVELLREEVAELRSTLEEFRKQFE